MSASAAGVLDGTWGGDRLRLVVDAEGAKLEADCASGRIAGPITLSRSGTFELTGVYEQYQAGPQRADTQARTTSARYSGEVKGDVMTLTILPAGTSTPTSYQLRKGAAVKLVRCM